MNDDQFQLLVKIIESLDKKVDDFKADTQRQFDEVREEIRELKTDTQRQFTEVKTEIREVKHDIGAEKDKLQKVYEARNRVQVAFGWQWSMASMFIAVVAAGVTKAFA